MTKADTAPEQSPLLRPNILEAEGIVKQFGSSRLFGRSDPVRAVDGVSLQVRKGERLAIVGESGCGKSTLGRCLLRLIEADAGSVRFEGVDLMSLDDKAMRQTRKALQIVFQDPYASLNPRHTVATLIGEPIRFHGLAKGRDVADHVARMLGLVGLPEAYASRYPHEFSGGQRQRIAIARALASGPRLLVGDEPVSALDVSIQAQIINLLEDLGSELGFTLVLIAHNLAVIRHVSERVAVMYLGEIVEFAPADALFETPLHPYTQALIASAPIADPAARRQHALLDGDPPSPSRPPSGCRFHTRCAHARARCSSERPVSETVEGGRSVSCHFWREIAAAGASAPLAFTPSIQRQQRIAVFADALRQPSSKGGSITP